MKEISFTDVFSDWICQKAKKDPLLHAVTPAMCSGSGLLEFSRRFPARFHDVGIAEQHAMTFSAGLSLQGKKPVLAIYSSFLQRAYDQLIHDVALENVDVLLAIDRAGIVGPDGATHAGSFDLSFLRIVPSMIVMAPATLNECAAMLEWGYEYVGPVAVRYPRGAPNHSVQGKTLNHSVQGKNEYDFRKAQKIKIEKGKAEIVEKGEKVAILAFGTMLEKCARAARETGATLVNMRFVKPLDEELLKSLAKTHQYFITVEDNVVSGGAGSAVNEFVLENGLAVRVKNLGLPDKFLPHGSRNEILAEAELSEESILKTVKEILKSSSE